MSHCGVHLQLESVFPKPLCSAPEAHVSSEVTVPAWGPPQCRRAAEDSGSWATRQEVFWAVGSLLAGRRQARERRRVGDGRGLGWLEDLVGQVPDCKVSQSRPRRVCPPQTPVEGGRTVCSVPCCPSPPLALPSTPQWPGRPGLTQENGEPHVRLHLFWGARLTLT